MASRIKPLLMWLIMGHTFNISKSKDDILMCKLEIRIIKSSDLILICI